MEAWYRFLSLSARSRRLVLEAAVGLVLTWLASRIVGFRHGRRLFDLLVPRPIRRAKATDSFTFEDARAIARWHRAAARHIPIHTNCLERSLVLCRQLQRRGLPAELQIGARKNHGKFEAHAWVEMGGAVVSDTRSHELNFTPFVRSIASLETERT